MGYVRCSAVDLSGQFAKAAGKIALMAYSFARNTRTAARSNFQSNECRAAVAIIRKLAEDNPAVAGYRGKLAYALIDLGDVERSLGRAAEARGEYERAIAIREQRLSTDSMNLNLVFGLARSIWRRGLTRLDLEDPAGAAGDEVFRRATTGVR